MDAFVEDTPKMLKPTKKLLIVSPTILWEPIQSSRDFIISPSINKLFRIKMIIDGKK